MADTKRLGALLVAAAACVGLGAAYAEGQHNAVNITGEIQIDGVKRKGTTTFTSAQNFTNVPADGSNPGFRNPFGTNKDESSLFYARVYLNFGVDLSQNAKVFIQLGGRGTMGGTTGQVPGNDANLNATGGSGLGDSSFAPAFRQAYVELHEVAIQQLGFRIGIKDMSLGLDRGDGNHFVMYSPEWGKHFQIRNGGVVDRAFSVRGRNGNLPVNSANGFDDLNDTGGGLFQWAVTYDQKEFSAELFYLQLQQTGSGFTNPSYIVGVDGKLPLTMVNEKSMLIGHVFNVKDSSIVPKELTAATVPGSGSNFWQYGLGADVFAMDSAFEAYGEFAIQQGKLIDGYDQTTFSGTDQGIMKDQLAYAYYLGVKVMVPGAADFKPALDVSYWSFSGDDNQHDNKNAGFINYGDEKSTLVVEDNTYGIGLDNNYNVYRIKGSVDLGGLLAKKQRTPLELSYHSFNMNAAKVASQFAPLSASYGVTDINPNHFGDEVDVTLTHEYSENVTFKLGYGLFIPGSYVRENANLSVAQQFSAGGATKPVLGTPGLIQGDGSPATVALFTTSVKF